jgi:hypothetical protein
MIREFLRKNTTRNRHIHQIKTRLRQGNAIKRRGISDIIARSSGFCGGDGMATRWVGMVGVGEGGTCDGGRGAPWEGHSESLDIGYETVL